MKNTFQRVTRHSGFIFLLALAPGFAFAVEPMMSKSEVKDLVKKASTPADHHRLALYFTQKADNMEAEAVEHQELAAEYANHPNGVQDMKHTMSDKTAGHCNYFVTAARKAAAEDRAIAAAHESMAKNAQK